MELTENKLARVQSSTAILKAAEPEGQFTAVLSTDDLDRHGEHVSISGLSIPKGQTIKMYYNHQTYGDSLPIGKWLRVYKSQGKLMGQGQIDLNDDFAVKVYQKILNGFIDSISIGFYPQEFDADTNTWTKSTLVEASVVAEPANVNAVITSKQLGFTEEEFTKSLKVKLKEVKSGDDEDVFVGSPGKPGEALEPDSADPPEEPNPPVEDGDSDTEVKTALEALKSRIGAVEETLAASTESPAIKHLIRVRMAAKQVDKAAEELNRVLKVKLKESSNE